MSLIAMLPGRAAVTVREINKNLTPIDSLPSCYGLKFSFSAWKYSCSRRPMFRPDSGLSVNTWMTQMRPNWIVCISPLRTVQGKTMPTTPWFHAPPPTHSTRQLHHIEDKDGKIFNKNLLHSGVAQEAACGGHGVARSASGPTESPEALRLPVRN